MSELEMKMEKRARNIIYFKIHTDTDNNSLEFMSDFQITLRTTSVVKHNPSTLNEIYLKKENLNLNAIIDILLNSS